jgi:predicted GIY-YIG superfamily endonuclease
LAASRAMEKRAAYRLEHAVKQLPRRRKPAAVRRSP